MLEPRNRLIQEGMADKLAHIAEDVHDLRDDMRVVRAKVELLNDWHNRVSGALWVIGALATAALAVGVVILRFLLERA